jgi:hypothetical protein
LSWKREFLDNTSLAFGAKPKKEDANSETEPRYNNIGRLQVVTDFLKKVLGK